MVQVRVGLTPQKHRSDHESTRFCFGSKKSGSDQIFFRPSRVRKLQPILPCLDLRLAEERGQEWQLPTTFVNRFSSIGFQTSYPQLTSVVDAGDLPLITSLLELSRSWSGGIKSYSFVRYRFALDIPTYDSCSSQNPTIYQV